ncbi:MAG TPA: MerR family transcriptional regulator [Candidatus Margulisiibacteriota bacterium]|nr:MerR family transcriptional regulator [Candidatus Margulisiibacteriota bacterium]
MADAKPQLPDKLYFKIGEVAAIVGVPAYVLRYWESEFSIVRPSKSRSRHRLYRRRDVETLLQIKRLLHDERFTIEGARKRLKTLQKEERQQAELPLGDRAYRTVLSQLRKEIESLHRMLT